jgi:hypothetical protein
VPSSPDGIGLYSKNSAVNHLQGSQVESGPVVVRATPLLLVHQRAVALLILPWTNFINESRVCDGDSAESSTAENYSHSKSF